MSLGSPSRYSLLLGLLLAILLAATALRLENLGTTSLWEDELFSADIVLQRPLVPQPGTPWLESKPLPALQDGGTESFWTVKAADQSPPMFELAAKAVTSLFGSGEASLRLTSALASLAALAWLAARAWRARAGPLMPVYLAVLVLVAFNGFMVFYAREARAYALGAALTLVLATRFWERSVTGWRQAPLPGWGEIALCVAACMTHYNALALVGLMLLPCAWEGWRRKDIAALARMAVVAAFVGGWLFMSYDSFTMAAQGDLGWMPKMSTRKTAEVLAAYFMREGTGPWLAGLLVLLLTTTVLASLGKPTTSADGKQLVRGATAAGALSLAAFGLAVLVAHKAHILNARHLIFAMPVLFLLAGSCAALLALRWPAALWLFLVTAAATQIPLVQAALADPKSDYRGATAFVVERLQDGDALITTPLLNPSAYNYYLHRTTKRFDRKMLSVPEQGAQLCTELSNHERIGFLGHLAGFQAAVAMKKACGDRYTIDFYLRHKAFAAVWTRK